MSFYGSSRKPNVKELEEKGNIRKLIKALKHKKSDVRRSAARALGRIGSHRAVGPLIAALKSNRSYSNVREATAEALGQIGSPRAVIPLVDALKYPYGVDVAAREALKKIGSSKIKPIIAALEDEDYQVRRHAANILREIGDPRSVPALIAAFKDDDKFTREAAARALGEIGDPRAVAPLNTALKDENTDVREAAARTLGEIGDPRAVAPLIATLKDDDWHVCNSAAEALGTIGDPRAVDSLIAKFKDVHTRREAVEALVKIGSPAIESLIAVLDDENSYVRKSAGDALGKLGWQPDQDAEGVAYWFAREEWDHCIEMGSAAVAPLIAALKDTEMDVRAASAEALGEIGDPQAVAPLITALNDEHTDVSNAAARALEKLGWQPDQDAVAVAYWIARGEWDHCIEMGSAAVAPLITALKDEKTDVRKVAARALGEIGDPRAVAPLITALNDDDWRVRNSAAEALGKIGDPRAINPLIARLNDVSLHKAAAEALVKIGSPAVETLVRSIGTIFKDFYDLEAAANALKKFYQSGQLDESQKQLILGNQEKLKKAHQDISSSHKDQGVSCFHSDSHRPHVDKTISLDYLL